MKLHLIGAAMLMLAGCAAPVVQTPAPPAPPTLVPPYARDHCGEDITPTHLATPDNVVCR